MCDYSFPLANMDFACAVLSSVACLDFNMFAQYLISSTNFYKGLIERK